MFKNYLQLSLKVLKRKPFYTFVSLFGISFTLTILMLITSMADASIGNNAPMTDRDTFVFVDMMERTNNSTDTILIIDSVLMESGVMRYDTTEDYRENSSTSTNGMNYKFLDRNLRDIESAENYTFMTNDYQTDVYLEGRKVNLRTFYVDANYWDVFDFTFVGGVPFTPEDNDQANMVVVITQKAAKEYYGVTDASVIGQEMVLNDRTFTVKGLVEPSLMDDGHVNGDVFMPLLTIDQRQLDQEELYGPFGAILKARTPEGTKAIQEELNFLAENYQMPPESYYLQMELLNASFFDYFAQSIVRERDPAKARRLLYIPMVLLLLLFIALPLINLINLNVSRVFERKGEIAVRKAFGANPSDILLQFIFENLVLTTIGGIIGIVLAVLFINYINAKELLGKVSLSLEPMVFVYFIFLILFFALLSGLIPAYRMSRTNIANSLR
ncbi:MAG: FtsX-like permease family protein [Bacteroidota bacterium]